MFIDALSFIAKENQRPEEPNLHSLAQVTALPKNCDCYFVLLIMQQTEWYSREFF